LIPPAGVAALPLLELPPCPSHAESSEIVTEKIAARTLSFIARIATFPWPAGKLPPRRGLISRVVLPMISISKQKVCAIAAGAAGVITKAWLCSRWTTSRIASAFDMNVRVDARSPCHANGLRASCWTRVLRTTPS